MGLHEGSSVTAFEEHFRVPDAGADKTPYACTFHWFRLDDDRICGLDVIRSDDTGQLGLRVFLFGADGGIRHLIRVAPAAEWAPFTTDAKPDALQTGDEVLGRGTGWIAGHARADTPDGGITDFRFDLQIRPETVGIGTGQKLGLALLFLTIEDFRRVRTTGTVIIDGKPHTVDAEGPCSIHYGSKLPQYAYVATVPRGASAASDLLLASAAGDDVRYLGNLLGGFSVTYAYLEDKSLPLLHLGEFQRPVKIGPYHLELDGVERFEHQLVGKTTVTGTALGALVNGDGERTPLGRVIFDYRGDYYVTRAP
jgi:hypothetical protein